MSRINKIITRSSINDTNPYQYSSMGFQLLRETLSNSVQRFLFTKCLLNLFNELRQACRESNQYDTSLDHNVIRDVNNLPKYTEIAASNLFGGNGRHTTWSKESVNLTGQWS